jgi:hypothetical protein
MDWDQQSKFNEDEEDDTKMKGFDVEISVYNEPKNDKKSSCYFSWGVYCRGGSKNGFL